MKKKKIIVLILTLILIVSGIIVYIDNKHFEDDNEVLKQQFAIYVETESGNFEEYKGKNFPIDEYVFDSERSTCIDNDGNKVEENIIQFVNDKVVLETNLSVNCFLYFNKQKSN